MSWTRDGDIYREMRDVTGMKCFWLKSPSVGKLFNYLRYYVGTIPQELLRFFFFNFRQFINYGNFIFGRKKKEGKNYYPIKYSLLYSFNYYFLCYRIIIPFLQLSDWEKWHSSDRHPTFILLHYIPDKTNSQLLKCPISLSPFTLCRRCVAQFKLFSCDLEGEECHAVVA